MMTNVTTFGHVDADWDIFIAANEFELWTTTKNDIKIFPIVFAMVFWLFDEWIFGIFFSLFQANWFKASQYCRFHGMHLASISSQEENDRLEKHIRDFGKIDLKIFK